MNKIGIHTFSWSLSELLESGLQPFNIVAGNDGRLYEIRHSDLGTIIVPAGELRRLEEIPKGFQFNLPKIPGELLSKVISFFRDYCKNEIVLEVMVSFFYHPVKEEYFVEVPEQKVTKERVLFDTVNFIEEGCIEVLQLHSHNNMNAYFSSIDNQDEKRYLLYGVVGKLNQESPEMLLRVGVNGHYYNLPLEYIFDNPNLKAVTDYPRKWHRSVYKF